MSVIQSIREKYAKWAVVAIALALLGFILTDYFQAKDRMGGANSTTLGTVNGKKIDWEKFEPTLQSMNTALEQQARANRQEFSETDRQMNNERLWNSKVEQILMTPEFKKVGIDIGKREFNDWLFGSNPPPDMINNFGDQQGNYDGATVQNQINQIKRTGTPAQKEQLEDFLAALEYSRKLEKFNSTLANSVYYPKWYVEKQNAEAAALAKVSYVSYDLTKIQDSTIKISDKEIEDYVNKNKEQYRQEESRSISFVIFDASPSAADSANLRKQLEDQKAEFAAATDVTKFLSRNRSSKEFLDIYEGKTQMLTPGKDSISVLSKNGVYGPYLEQNSYVLAKLIDSKSMPDSVKARHILIPTFDPQSGQQMLDDSTAKKRIDSIEQAIKGGARFDSLAVKYSSDQSSAIKGGLLSNPNNPATNYFTVNTMVKEFNDFCFEGKKGDKKVVKTTFGYHLIEILDQKNPQPHYKVAYFAKNIIASEETERTVFDEASKFSADSKDMKTFDANIAKANGRIEKLEAANIGPNDVSVQSINQALSMGFGQAGAVPCRKLIKEIYKAAKGEVLGQEKIGDQKNGYKYVVAIVTDVLEKGLQPARVARPKVEPILKNEKKVEEVKKMIATATTLEAVAAILKDSIITVDSIRMQTNNRYGFSPKAIGAIFNNANKGKLINQPFGGVNSIVVIRVDDITTTSVLSGDMESQKAQLRLMTKGMQSQFSSPVMILRKNANIKDNRRNFY